MVRQKIAKAMLLLCGLSLGGCDKSYEYRPPANLTPLSAAIITGSKVETPGLAGDVRVYLLAIDGKLTLDGPHGWDDRVLAEPGTHLIGFGISQGSVFSVPGRTDYAGIGGKTQATFEPGKLYILRATVPVPSPGGSGACVVGWIESQDGRLASEKVTVKLAQRGGEIAAPIGSGGFIPIPMRGGDISAVSCPG